MQSRLRVHGAKLFEHPAPEKMGLMILGIHGIHMNDTHDAEFAVEPRLQAVDDLVGMHQGEVRGYFSVERDDLMPGPVIVDHQVMHIKDALCVKDDLLDL